MSRSHNRSNFQQAVHATTITTRHQQNEVSYYYLVKTMGCDDGSQSLLNPLEVSQVVDAWRLQTPLQSSNLRDG